MPVYLDCNATTPVEPEVLEAMIRAWRSGPANAGSRTHSFGASAKKAVEHARDAIGRIVGSNPDDVLLTSGATEANNLALLGLSGHGTDARRRHIVSTQIEHKAVLDPLEALVREGFKVTLVPPVRGGWVDHQAIAAAVRPDTLLVSVMHVNNETGVVQPIQEIAALIADHPAYFHVDAAQGFGKSLEDLSNPRIDLISVSAHKIYGPQGVGALITRRRGYKRPPLRPVQHGGGQERGLRPGTTPVPLAIGFGVAAELAISRNAERIAACVSYRDRVYAAFAPLRPVVNGDPARTMPNAVNLSFPGVNSEALMVALKDFVAISNGSACTSHSYTPSHVLQAMGLSDGAVGESVRISWCHNTEHPDWDAVATRIEQLRPLRAE